MIELNVEKFPIVCRICLSESKEAEAFIPINDNKNGILLVDVLSEFIPLEDLMDNRLPQKLCPICVEHIKFYHTFKNKCSENESFLKKCLEQSETKYTKFNIKQNETCSPSDDNIIDELPLIKRVENFVSERKNRKLPIKGERLKNNIENESVCQICNKKFSFRYKLEAHYRVHTGEKPFKCDVCQVKFSIRGNLRRHQKIHTGEKPHVCHLCGKGFIQTTSLKVHLNKHKDYSEDIKPQTKLECHKCGRDFVRVKAYNLHMKKHHQKLEENDASESQIDKKDIQTSHTNNIRCNICGRGGYANLTILKRHIARHGEKQFLCCDCGKGFVCKAGLRSHIKIHTGEKPHKCSICKKSFAHRGSLITHNLMHTGFKPYKCDICNKPFSQSSHLKIHQRIHNGERPYSCSYCQKTFSLKQNLTVHIRTHTGETPYTCSICDKGFFDSSSMKKHKAGHRNYMERDFRDGNPQAII